MFKSIINAVFVIFAILASTSTITFAQSVPEPDKTVYFKIPASNPEGFQFVGAILPVTGTRHAGRPGCNGVNNQYAVITAGPTLPVVKGGKTLTQAYAEDYWEYVYDGYSGGHSVDWTQNCHGYAFGVGDWVFESAKIVGSGPTSCWVQDASNATIAYSSAHSVKITMKDCKVCIGVIIENSSEKFRESGVYTQTAACPDEDELDLSKGRLERKGLTFDLIRLR